MNDNPVLRQALRCADHGWPVFPCQPGRKIPATRHGYLDATTDPAQIRAWFATRPDRNLAVATGAPGPDVLDIDYRGPDADGVPALTRLREAGLLDGTNAVIRTPNRGFHLYYSGSDQSSAHLPDSHIDFLSQGGYVLVPPSRVGGRPYEGLTVEGEHGGLDWNACVAVLAPARSRQQSASRATPADPGHQMGALARWVAAQPEGNRNAGLFWAANRALEADRAADLSPLAAAARQAGLTDSEISRTLESARRTQASPQSPQPTGPEPPDPEAEGSG